MVGCVGAFEEVDLLKEFTMVLDSISSALAVVGRHGPPSAIAKMLVNDGLRILDDFAREYRRHVGKAMDHVCEELRSLLYEVIGGE
jgi:hypothetical protein